MPGKERLGTLCKLDKEFENLWVGGAGKGGSLKNTFLGAYNAAFNEWSCRSKIGLSLVPTRHLFIDGYITYRLLNTMATGTFVLTTYTAGLEKHFTQGVHLDWYTGYHELVEKLLSLIHI